VLGREDEARACGFAGWSFYGGPKQTSEPASLVGADAALGGEEQGVEADNGNYHAVTTGMGFLPIWLRRWVEVPWDTEPTNMCGNRVQAGALPDVYVLI
jgi:hypothetical protein